MCWNSVCPYVGLKLRADTKKSSLPSALNAGSDEAYQASVAGDGLLRLERIEVDALRTFDLGLRDTRPTGCPATTRSR